MAAVAYSRAPTDDGAATAAHVSHVVQADGVHVADVHDVGKDGGELGATVAAGEGFLLHSSELATNMKTFGNIFISFVGAGILGLPYAFRKSGLLLGGGFLLLTAFTSLHCMLLLVQCKRKLEDKGVVTYSQVVLHAFGPRVAYAVDCLLIISQVGFCMGYLVFIGQNTSSIDELPKWSNIFATFPVLAALATLRSLASLAPFSIFADCANVLGILVVLYHDLIDGWANPPGKITAISGPSSLPFLFGVSMYCYEGFGMILPIEASMKDRSQFQGVLTAAMGTITALFLTFAALGYSAYGNHTEDIITLNLPHDASAITVKLSLCLGLLFTFPVMLVPVYEIVEGALLEKPWFVDHVRPSQRKQAFDVVRVCIVALTVLLAAVIPGFGIFISLVGSLVCALLAFVIPSVLHCVICSQELSSLGRMKNFAIIAFGVTGAVLGTLDTIHGVLVSESAHYTDIKHSLTITVGSEGMGVLEDAVMNEVEGILAPGSSEALGLLGPAPSPAEGLLGDVRSCPEGETC